MKATGLIIVLLVFGASDAYRSFQDEIPNGDHVPHPCKPNFIWRGVGHMNLLGGGVRNNFGRDFRRAGKTWTKELCRNDSDSDGRTNGQELGDPNCIWTKGFLPSTTVGITHPGVCDPWASDRCKDANKNITCDTGEFVCDGINSPDVFNVTLRFPPTPVPAQETTYICYTFEMDMFEPDVEYHLIATQPYIDNPNVMHHMTLMGCDSSSQPIITPYECIMATNGCNLGLGGWTLGMPGECLYHETGFKVSRKSTTRFSIQHHWTNPELRTDYVDSSGMILYFTRKLRRYNAGYLSLGELHLGIPPGEKQVVEQSTCSAACTRKILKAPVKLISGWNHMHYLGYRGNVEHFRDGVKLRDLTPDDVYSYDSPVFHWYDPLIEVLPGDVLKTTCVYRSTSRSKTTMYGPGSYDEMCFAFFNLFPVENVVSPSCMTWDDIEFCYMEGFTLHGCDLAMLFNASSPERQALFAKITDNCNINGECRRECQQAINEVQKHPCMTAKLQKFTESNIASVGVTLDSVKFLAGIQSCQCLDNDHVTWPYPSHAVKETATLIGVTFLASIVTIVIGQ